MGYRGFMRGMAATVRRMERAQIAANRRAEREALRNRRALLAQMAAAERMAAQQRAAHEQALFDNYLEVIVSVHKEACSEFDWRAVAAAAPPAQPPHAPHREAAAQAALSAYRPSFWDRLLGRGPGKRDALAQEVERARQLDHAEFQSAVQQHQEDYASWEWMSRIGRGVLDRDLEAFRAVLENLSPFDELSELGTTVRLDDLVADAVAVTATVRDAEVVPKTELRTTAAGKQSTKAMPVGRYWELYQDHVCSCALRVARELFGMLPVTCAVVNVETVMLDQRTGYMEPTPILAVRFVRRTFEGLNLDALDPSEAMKKFAHEMKFKKSAGFSAIRPLSLHDAAAEKSVRAVRSVGQLVAADDVPAGGHALRSR